MVLKAIQIVAELLDVMPALRCDEAHGTGATQRLEFCFVYFLTMFQYASGRKHLLF